jgi:hypothetical protein
MSEKEVKMVNSHALYALAHPVYDPARQITAANYWAPLRHIAACLSVNIGLE